VKDAGVINCCAGFNIGSGFHLTFQSGATRDSISSANNDVGAIKFSLLDAGSWDNFDF